MGSSQITSRRIRRQQSLFRFTTAPAASWRQQPGRPVSSLPLTICPHPVQVGYIHLISMHIHQVARQRHGTVNRRPVWSKTFHSGVGQTKCHVGLIHPKLRPFPLHNDLSHLVWIVHRTISPHRHYPIKRRRHRVSTGYYACRPLFISCPGPRTQNIFTRKPRIYPSIKRVITSQPRRHQPQALIPDNASHGPRPQSKRHCPHHRIRHSQSTVQPFLVLS